jgi:hypothetical protein
MCGTKIGRCLTHDAGENGADQIARARLYGTFSSLIEDLCTRVATEAGILFSC